MSSEYLAAIIVSLVTGVVETIAILVAFHRFNQKHTLDRQRQDTELRDKRVDTTVNELGLHNDAIRLLLERDKEIVTLSRAVAQAQADLDTMKATNDATIAQLQARIAQLEDELRIERGLREALQRQLDEERAKQVLTSTTP